MFQYAFHKVVQSWRLFGAMIVVCHSHWARVDYRTFHFLILTSLLTPLCYKPPSTIATSLSTCITYLYDRASLWPCHLPHFTKGALHGATHHPRFWLCPRNFPPNPFSAIYTTHYQLIVLCLLYLCTFPTATFPIRLQIILFPCPKPGLNNYRTTAA